MKQTKRAFTKVVALVSILMLLIAATVIPSSAATANTINDATRGVFFIVYTYTYDIQPDAPDILMGGFSYGTGFLINEDTVVTAYHVFHNDDVVETLRALYGDNYLSKMQIRVYYKSGAFVRATEIQAVANSSYDFTALKLATPINGAQQLTLAENADENTLQSPAQIYSLGYPYTSVENEAASELMFTPADVDTRNGIVNKFEYVDGIRLLKHTAVTTYGMSGGPVIDANGVVVGINRYLSLLTEVENWAVPTFNLIDSLNQMNIPYTSISYGSAPTPTAPADDDTTAPEEIPDTTVPAPADKTALAAKIDEASKLNGKDYKSGFQQVEGALSTAQRIYDDPNASQQDVDSALADLTSAINDLPNPGPDIKLIIIIAVAAVVLIALIVILLIVMKKKKGEEDFDAPTGFAPPQNGGFTPPQGGFAPPQGGGFAPAAPAAAPRFTPAPTPTAPGGAETSVLSKGGNETTVLSSGSNETTVLTGKPYAKLTRKSNNEIIQVAAATFVIGKERRKVNYCIEDNSTISRSHAQIMSSGTKVSVMDLGSKNGTFVNGVKCNPSEAVAVKDGDKITLSDEEFIINLI